MGMCAEGAGLPLCGQGLGHMVSILGKYENKPSGCEPAELVRVRRDWACTTRCCWNHELKLPHSVGPSGFLCIP